MGPHFFCADNRPARHLPAAVRCVLFFRLSLFPLPEGGAIALELIRIAVEDAWIATAATAFVVAWANWRNWRRSVGQGVRHGREMLGNGMRCRVSGRYRPTQKKWEAGHPSSPPTMRQCGLGRIKIHENPFFRRRNPASAAALPVHRAPQFASARMFCSAKHGFKFIDHRISRC